MKTIYVVLQEHVCDDPHYQTGPAFIGAYATQQLAQAAVGVYTEECRAKYQQELDEHTVEIDGRTYRWCDLHNPVDYEAAGICSYTHKPKTEISMDELWERYPERYVQEVEVEVEGE